jgi:single-stranded-DNA-specific exonuclease
VPASTTWLIPAPSSALAARAADKLLGLGHPLVAAVLARRGLVGEARSRYLNPELSRLEDPHTLRHLDAAVRVLDEAVRGGRKIVVYGDYDVDGTSATALVVTYLRNIGADAGYFIPHRLSGYGLSRESLEAIISAQAPALIVTVDCGTSSRVEVDYARGRGVEVIVTDHHQASPGKETVGIVVNPHGAGDTSPNKGLAGVGVAYKLVAGHYGKGQPAANLDLVALGTIADVMPLFDVLDPVSGATIVAAAENRILVRAGLDRLAHSSRVGIQALLASAVRPAPCPHGVSTCTVCAFAGVACRHGTPYCYAPTAADVGFQIGPRINAIGRVGLDPNLVVELFITRDADRARVLAAQLDAANQERKTKTDALLEEALGKVDLDDPVIVLQMELFKGYAGLVAGRLTSEFNRPSIVVDLDGGGSARSVAGVPLLDVLQRECSRLVTAAGHQMAMGISRLTDPEALRAQLRAYPWPAGLGVRDLVVDAVCELSDIDLRLARALRRLEPTGNGNPTPLFAVSGVRVAAAKLMTAGKHVRLTLTQPEGGSAVEALWFGGGPAAPAVGAIVDVAGRVVLARGFRDNAEVAELHVVSLRPTVERLPVTLGAVA